MNQFKKTWNWIWKSNSIWSWIVALILIYIFIKFIFFPGLSLATGTVLPLAGVESSSMDHQIVKDDFGFLSLCGNIYTKSERKNIVFNEYWEICGDWYEKREITKKEFKDFPMKNGFKKGDIVIVWGRFEPEVGDIIIFKANPESIAPRPIVHRVVNSDPLQTKGDHNEQQLSVSNNPYKTDETNIHESQIIGKVVLKIPYLGWFKIWVTDFLNWLF